ncbi:MAG: hypothetical protein U9Q70_02350 [Chloroflexota bacterium]|nr:hypothetical protein [Chloroflexota bacterium]
MTSTPTPEYRQVEAPFIRQLQAQGWDYLKGDVDVPYLTERDSFRQVLLTERLRAALRPERLLDIVHNFTLFDSSGGRLKKIVPRYQQYRRPSRGPVEKPTESCFSTKCPTG